MSDVLGQWAQVRTAFDQPTLTLLHRADAAVTVTLLRTCFSREIVSIETSRLHQLLDNLAIDLRNTGVQVKDLSGREMCQRWVRSGWLRKRPDAAAGDVYVQTVEAQAALALVGSMEMDRPTFSEHSVSTLIETARRFNAAANPSRQRRLEILASQIKPLQDEYDRLMKGGEIVQASMDYMVQGYVELLRHISEIPMDFQRVSERYDQIRRDILERFRSEAHTPGSVIDTYIAEADRLTTSTPEGRAFEGAFTLLRNQELLMQLRHDVDALLAHPHADVLSVVEKRQLRSTVQVLERGLADVLEQRTKASKSIKDYLATHDVARDRQLDATLRALDAAFGLWFERTGPRTKIQLELLPEILDVEYLPRKFHDPQRSAPPPPLVDDNEDDEADGLAELVAWGGPAIPALTEALAAAAGGGGSVADLFNALPVSMRRPVDVMGLLHLTDAEFDVEPGEGVDVFHAVRPDGTTRTFTTARTAVPAATEMESDQ